MIYKREMQRDYDYYGRIDRFGIVHKDTRKEKKGVGAYDDKKKKFVTAEESEKVIFQKLNDINRHHPELAFYKGEGLDGKEKLLRKAEMRPDENWEDV